MPKGDGTGPPETATGPRNGQGGGYGHHGGKGSGQLSGGKKGVCAKEDSKSAQIKKEAEVGVLNEKEG